MDLILGLDLNLMVRLLPIWDTCIFLIYIFILIKSKDPLYVNLTKEILDKKHEKPFFLALNIVNPHDICLGSLNLLYSLLYGFPMPSNDIPI